MHPDLGILHWQGLIDTNKGETKGGYANGNGNYSLNYYAKFEIRCLKFSAWLLKDSLE